jgi:hypothetical protein
MIVDQPLAPFAVLAFLGTALFTVAMTALVLVARFTGKTALSGRLLKLLGGGLGLYFVVLLGVSAFSKDYLLRPGAEKHYCEMDCHLAYSVTSVERVASLPPGFSGTPAPAPGQLYLVTLRTRFDETTIGPNRGNGLLYPNPREIEVRDDYGKTYRPPCVTVGKALTEPLRPGESYETRILFNLPPEAKNPRMLLRNSPWPNAFLIGHENSPLHGKAYFDLKG